MIMDDTTRQDMRRFVNRWRDAGEALRDQRHQELSRLKDEQARCQTRDLFAMWCPSGTDDFGAELVAQQQVFRLLRGRRPVPR